MKKLMIAALVAACAASTSQAGLLSKVVATLSSSKTATVVVAQPATQEINVDTVDLMSLNEAEFEQVILKSDTKLLRSKLLTKFRKVVENWKAKKGIEDSLKRATLKVIDGLNKADVWLARHWREEIAPTLRKAWKSVKKFFGGKTK